jgi:hypothetical protein
MRVPSYAAWLWAWALLAGCLAAPRPEDWLAVGHRTPEATFATFQTALRADLPELEYRCLGSDFKRRLGADLGSVSLLGYLEFRRELFRSQPWLKLAATARVKEVRALSERRVRLVAEVDTWFHDEIFALEFVREDFWELYSGANRRADDFAPWRELVVPGEGELRVHVPLPAGLTAREVSELRAGQEWKIDAFLENPANALDP